MLVSVAVALLLVAVLLGIWALALRARTGLPWVPVIYQDTARQIVEKPLIARQLGLTGRPDYLVALRGYIIPVEVKPGRQASVPYESDLMQLATYCVLVEETYHSAPPYGLLRYEKRTFRLDYTPHVRGEVLALVDEMRVVMEQTDCARSHDDPPRCRSCGFFEQCDQAIDLD